MSEKNIKKIGMRDALGEYIYTDIGVDADKVDIDSSTNLAEKLVEIDNKFENLKAEGYANKDIYGDEKINLGRKVGTSAGPYSVTIGRDVSATGTCSLAEGKDTAANGNYSHVEGMGTIAAGDFQHAQGKFNNIDNDQKYAHIVGGGSNDFNRKNIHTLDWDGNAEFAGDVITYNDKGVKVSLKNIPNEYAPVANPTFSGTPKAPTPATGNNSTQIATTAFVQSTLANKYVTKNELSNKISYEIDTVSRSTSTVNLVTLPGDGHATYTMKYEKTNKIPIAIHNVYVEAEGGSCVVQSRKLINLDSYSYEIELLFYNPSSSTQVGVRAVDVELVTLYI